MARESAPSLSATFYPGGDDYYYPELVSPLPQRYVTANVTVLLESSLF